MTREEAKAAGLKRYPGQPCSKGHNGERYTASNNCCQCNAERVKRNRPKSAAAKAAKPVRTVLSMSKGFEGFAPHSCEWIDGEPQVIRSGINPHCGNPARENSAYCAEHHMRCYVRQSARSA